MSALVGAASAVKSVQRGTISLTSGAASGTATISSVNTAKCALKICGQSRWPASTAANGMIANLVLTNSTTVTASRGDNLGSSQCDTSFEVIEYN